MQGPHLVYVADPMCSWCWGFAPVIAAVRARFSAALPIRLVMGGLRPGTTKPLDAAGKATIREHWEHVHEASGQPFEFGFFDREGFVYDTEPASVAVVVARRRDRDIALDYLDAVQRAFYAENRDVTEPGILAEIAAPFGFERDAFLADLGSEAARQDAWTDFAIAQRAGIRGFPTLLAGTGDEGRYVMVTHGFQPAERILPTLAAWLSAVEGAPGPAEAP
jgi:putative protein-disulfide isomerase